MLANGPLATSGIGATVTMMLLKLSRNIQLSTQDRAKAWTISCLKLWVHFATTFHHIPVRWAFCFCSYPKTNERIATTFPRPYSELKICDWNTVIWIFHWVRIVMKLYLQNCPWSQNGYIHYSDVIMAAMTYQISISAIVYSTVYSGGNQRKHQSSTSLAFVRGIHRWRHHIVIDIHLCKPSSSMGKRNHLLKYYAI